MAGTRRGGTKRKAAAQRDTGATKVPKRKPATAIVGGDKGGGAGGDDAVAASVLAARATANANFDKCVATQHYWSVVDAWSTFKEWVDEYYCPIEGDGAVPLKAPVVYGVVEVQLWDIRAEHEIADGDWDRDTFGVRMNAHTFKVGRRDKSTTLTNYMSTVLRYIAKRAEAGELPGNIYHMRRVDDTHYRVLLGA